MLTKSGLLVGAVVGDGYFCSNDEGAFWYQIRGLPTCGYQPYMAELCDGRLICTWHVGGDNFFGELDQWIGSHTFRLEADLPQPVRLTLVREMNEEKTKYINAYVATLTSGDRSLVGKTINFSVSILYAEGYEQFPLNLIGVTDAEGRARISLESHFVNEKNIHQLYYVNASFTPKREDLKLAPCKSATYQAYTATMTKGELEK